MSNDTRELDAKVRHIKMKTTRLVKMTNLEEIMKWRTDFLGRLAMVLETLGATFVDGFEKRCRIQVLRYTTHSNNPICQDVVNSQGDLVQLLRQ
jgi:hypothetical protein